MSRTWIEKYAGPRGVRYRVNYRLGGRASVPLRAGTFPTKREAERRRSWIRDELAVGRIPDVRLVNPEPSPTLGLGVIAEKWRASRVDVSAATATTHRVNLARIIPEIGMRPVDAITPDEIAALVVTISNLKRESIRKTIATCAMVFDHAGVVPNPARDKRVKLPQEDKLEVNPRAHWGACCANACPRGLASERASIAANPHTGAGGVALESGRSREP